MEGGKKERGREKGGERERQADTERGGGDNLASIKREVKSLCFKNALKYEQCGCIHLKINKEFHIMYL